MKSLLNNILKKIINKLSYKFGQEPKLDHRCSPSTKAALLLLWNNYQQQSNLNQLTTFKNTGLRVYSQFEEDGFFIYLFSVIGVKKKIFIDIGSSDGINSNCANLAINFGWYGLFIDGNSSKIKKGIEYYSKHPDTWLYPPKFIHAMVQRENINEIISSNGIIGDVDLLSIDIDGNDYWVWDAIDCINPSVVIIETHVEFGMENIVVPYNKNYSYPGIHENYHGASPMAMVKLGSTKGYRLVGANSYGFNFIFVKKGIADSLIPEISIEEVLQHPRNVERFKLFKEIENYPYLRV